MKLNSWLALAGFVFLAGPLKADISESVTGPYRHFWIYEGREEFSSTSSWATDRPSKERYISPSEAYPRDEFFQWRVGLQNFPVLVKPAIDVRQVKWNVPEFKLSPHLPCFQCDIRMHLGVKASVQMSQFDKLQNLPIYNWSYLISLHSLFMNETDMAFPATYTYSIDSHCHSDDKSYVASYNLAEKTATEDMAPRQDWTYDNEEMTTIRKSDYEHLSELCKVQGGSYLDTILTVHYKATVQPHVLDDRALKVQFLGVKIQEIVEP
ncbi:MAG TPA: hypothetical protein VE954_17995 [Oligoflexus sp.]|uniref:hypothetical protein n=1 Tax=Oligoflexus sp. TaxID=1971216 RepID=UPI002D406484|nr:hypothetical protein [Oligoflexus sp.]HYX34992.1 hypothetical protein [Oligoflexus sp.]